MAAACNQRDLVVANACLYRLGVGLTWKARGGERPTFDARDASGRHCGHVTNISGPWTIYLCPWACGREGGLATGHFEDATEAMAEADRIAAVCVGDDARDSADPRERDP